MVLAIAEAVAVEVGRSAGPADAYRRAISVIIDSLDLAVAAAWELDGSGQGSGLRATAIRHVETGEVEEFVRVTRGTSLEIGEGLPGRVWASCSGEWVADIAEDRNFPRRAAAQAAGLHTAICFPVRSERGVIAALEGFASDVRERDDELLGTLEVLGITMGQLVERHRAERSGEEVARRHLATVEASLDAVIAMDAEGRVVEFNPAAERIFGYADEDAVGREMAALIVPPDLRERHRAGLRRYLESGEPRLLDRRIEIEACRASGERFPVELTITRIDIPGPPVFTGHLRDITDRRRAERELRESRTRLVEAADEARRRIERDLHDGSQQQLVSVAMTLRGARDALAQDTAEAGELLDEASSGLQQAIDELRELARGIHPSVLSDGGLTPALRGLATRSPLPTQILAVPEQRFAPRLEAAAYFVAAEGLTNAARHAAGASGAEIELRRRDGSLTIEVRDDGPGGADAEGGGLRGLADRVSALGGRFEVESPAGGGTTLRAEVPCES
jgi:PAS domain S-box-containing protein